MSMHGGVARIAAPTVSPTRVLTSMLLGFTLVVALALPSSADGYGAGTDREQMLPAGDSGLMLLPDSSQPPVSADDEEDLWDFCISVPMYVWYPNLRGNATVHFEDDGAPDSEVISFHLNHGEIFDLLFSDLNGIYMFQGEVQRSRVKARLDLFYIGVDHVSIDDDNLSIPDRFIGLDQEIGITLVHPSLAFQLFETSLDLGPFDSFEFSLGAGFRYFYLQYKARISDSVISSLDGLTVLDVSEHYFEALPVGAEFRLGFCDKWSLNARVLLGGWGIGNAKRGTDGIADAFVAYRMNKNFSIEVGMRWLDLDVEGNDFDWTMRNMWGPKSALIWNF